MSSTKQQFQFFPKGKLTWMAIILCTVISITICMLFWENMNLIETTSNTQNDDKARILMLQSEINGQHKKKKKDLESITNTHHKEQSNILIKPWNPNNADNINPELSELPPPKYYNTDPIYFNPLNHPKCHRSHSYY